MDKATRIDELAHAVALLADAIESVASFHGHFDATNAAQVARERAQQGGGRREQRPRVVRFPPHCAEPST